MNQFPPCLAFTLKEEGGYTVDSGGSTRLGITAATLSHWRGRVCTPADVSMLKAADVTPIYEAMYWNTLRCWALPAGVDLMIFDFGVNAGPQRAAVQLQEIAGVNDDGIIGPLTAIAARGAGAKMLIPALYSAQADHYRSCADFPKYGDGWLARAGRRRDLALSLAGLPAAQGVSA